MHGKEAEFYFGKPDPEFSCKGVGEERGRKPISVGPSSRGITLTAAGGWETVQNDSFPFIMGAAPHWRCLTEDHGCR